MESLRNSALRLFRLIHRIEQNPSKKLRSYAAKKLFQIQQGILLHTICADLEVDVDTRFAVHAAGITHPRDFLPAGDLIADFHVQLFVMGIEGHEAVAVIDFDDVAVAAVPAGVRTDDRASFRSEDRPAAFLLDVDRVVPRVEVLREGTFLTRHLENAGSRRGGDARRLTR
jgi:hypothetical protein